MAAWFWPAALELDLAVLLLAFFLDLALPETPTRLHPVGWMGKVIAFLERRAPFQGRVLPFAAGLFIAVGVPACFAAAAGWAAVGLAGIGQAAYVIGGALLLRSMFTLKGLRRASLLTRRRLETGDLAAARHSLRNLVSRDPAQLSAAMVAGAAVESVAENTTDSCLAPWLFFAVLGLPGAVAYRAINTLDSMIGYRGRYEYLGKASARLDDLVNLIPARLSALFIVAAGAALETSPPAPLRKRRGVISAGNALRVLRQDRRKTASPNAGWTMSAMSGLLGVRLDKPGHYSLGERLREPTAADIQQATRVVTAAAVLGLLGVAALLAARHWLAG